ncbi:23583_t:CDS:2, partial [Dentiscutata erythropus]
NLVHNDNDNAKRLRGIIYPNISDTPTILSAIPVRHLFLEKIPVSQDDLIKFEILSNIPRQKSSRHTTNKQYYEKNRERILQRQRTYCFNKQIRLKYLESVQASCSQFHSPPLLPSINDLLSPISLNTTKICWH